ncbi:kinase-like protein [Paxillus ammoniavirescens]|nr:kinase-like protein [Paxillus ammoniavirescens]
MASINQSSQPHDRSRNIVFFGETGAGKSSTINLIAGSSVARTSNDTESCTRVSTCHKTTIRSEAFNLWDTRGLRESLFHSLFKRSSEGELKKFLRERHDKGEIDLLVYCVRGSRAKEAQVKNYKTFCAVTRRLAAPVVIVVTSLERENNMEDWWERNESSLRKLGMEFDGHACITALPDHPRETESRTTLHDLITRDYPWQAACDGSYFGSPLPQRKTAAPVATGSTRGAHNGPRSTAARPRTDTTHSEAPPSPGAWIPGKNKISDLWMKATHNRRVKQRFAGERPRSARDSLASQSSYHTQDQGAKQSPAGERLHSARNSLLSQPPTPTSYHTAHDRTPRCSITKTPVIGIAAHIQITGASMSISTDYPKDTVLSKPLSEETDSPVSCLHCIFPGSTSSSLGSELDPKLFVEDQEGIKPYYRDLTAVIKKRGQYAIRSGSFGDIWECELVTGKAPRKVAVKAVRAHKRDTQHLAAQKKKLNRELKVWAKLRHENIVPLLGVVSGFSVLPSMVSPWFSNGSLSSYLSKHEAMDLCGRQHLLFDIASGLRYLHSQDVIHGDLHIGNVLVDDNGRACLTDFGLSLIIRDFVGTSYLKSSVCGSVRYADPELVRQVHADARVVYPTKSSDIYSFGGLTLYVLSGKQPYEGVREILITASHLRGKRPLLPVDDKRISPTHQSLIRRCWSPQEKTRPSAEDIMTSLQVLSDV